MIDVTRLRIDRSRLLFHARYEDGLIEALTGQPATFARSAAATDSSLDTNGGDVTTGAGHPRFIDPGDGVLTLHVVPTADQLYYAWSLPHGKAWSALATFVAAPSTAFESVFVIGGASNPRVALETDGAGGIQVVHHNGSSSRTQDTTSLSLSAGDVVEALVRFQASGAVQVLASVDGGALVDSGASSSLSPASWSASRLYVGGITGSDTGALRIRSLKFHPDPDASIETMRGAT